MRPQPESVPVLLLAAGLMLAAGGAVLLQLALKRRGGGDTPGPEPRRRRPVMLALGSVVGLLGLGLLGLNIYTRVGGADWYTRWPAGWVIDDLRSEQPEKRDKAWEELSRRMEGGRLPGGQQAKLSDALLDLLDKGAGEREMAFDQYLLDRWTGGRLTPPRRERFFKRMLGEAERAAYGHTRRMLDTLLVKRLLSDGQKVELVETALREQAREKPAVRSHWMMDYLGRLETDGQLGEEQRRRFFEQGLKAKLVTRQTVVAGEDVAYLLSFEGRGPEDGWWAGYSEQVVKLDGKEVARHSMRPGPGFASGRTWSFIPVKDVGKHKLEVELALVAYAGNDQKEAMKERPRFEEKRTLTAEFEAVKEAPPGLIKKAEGEGLDERMREAISPVFVETGVGLLGRGLAVWLDVVEPPAPLACEVFVRVGGKESRLGVVVMEKGRSARFDLANYLVGLGDAGEVDVVVRSSEAVARKTVDLSEIWMGELVYERVRVGAEQGKEGDLETFGERMRRKGTRAPK